ncbi:pilus assembly FimT family protein [Calothrix sp. NIES-3974]|uniref:pilus assembly FimT family protein n=1 Tax=Calothrix sp. NIES-3974 TaxID=2005462 RepID=UPI000B6200FB|nr:type II secretion system protein [Calothrix sp. NIES-3974]BAZ04375.1 hypothetical protein NIES3974_10130 [Calothrix sp. NIES-3974]
MSKYHHKSSSSGFTTLEVLIVLILVGILSAIALPTWLNFLAVRRLNTAQNQVYLALRKAQSEATQNKRTWQASFRSDSNGVVSWAVHPANPNQFIHPDIRNQDGLWQKLPSDVRIDETVNPKGNRETTIPKATSASEWRILFNYQGCPVYAVSNECIKTSLRTLGQITLHIPTSSQIKRCVYVSTVLGALRQGKEHTQPNNSGKYCY